MSESTKSPVPQIFLLFKMPFPVEISFIPGLRKPAANANCLIVGQLANLKRVKFDDIACKLETKVEEQVK